MGAEKNRFLAQERKRAASWLAAAERIQTKKKQNQDANPPREQRKEIDLERKNQRTERMNPKDKKI
jgi:hypothetical protein